MSYSYPYASQTAPNGSPFYPPPPPSQPDVAQLSLNQVSFQNQQLLQQQQQEYYNYAIQYGQYYGAMAAPYASTSLSSPQSTPSNAQTIYANASLFTSPEYAYHQYYNQPQPPQVSQQSHPARKNKNRAAQQVFAPDHSPAAHHPTNNLTQSYAGNNLSQSSDLHSKSLPQSKSQQGQPQSQSQTPLVPLECTNCDKTFSNQKSLSAHLNGHVPCTHPGCEFAALRKIVREHEENEHGIGLPPPKIRLDTPEDIANWIKERKRNWPTATKVAEKIDEGDERRARGEIGVGGSNRGGNSYVELKRKTREGEGEDEAARKKTGEGKRPCKYFVAGRCRHGDKCRYSHEVRLHFY